MPLVSAATTPAMLSPKFLTTASCEIAYSTIWSKCTRLRCWPLAFTQANWSICASASVPRFVNRICVTWGIVAPDLSRSNSKPLIVGSSYVGDSQTPDEKFFWQPRTIEEARQIRFRGESVPGDLLYQYSSQYLGGGMDPMALADRQQNEINKAQAAQEKQNRLTPADEGDEDDL